MIQSYEETEDGVEKQWGTNHLGHFYFTQLLMPYLRKGAPSRVICVSSVASNWIGNDKLDVAKVYPPKADGYNPTIWYGYSKIANQLHALELNNRFQEQGITAYSLHPGWVYDTNLAQHLPAVAHCFIGCFTGCFACCNENMKTTPQGAATNVALCVAEASELKGGLYYMNCIPA